MLFSAPAAAAPGSGVYIALGDSYTSGPLVPNQHGSPIDCGRSDHNYPSLIAAEFQPAEFIDVSCGSAKTKDMAAPQTGLPLGGTNPPQFDALRADATLVTVGIGGNDAGLVGVGEKCGQLGLLDPFGTACRDYYAPGGNDSVQAK
ncbi:MAG: SGNH/GDSL hydrolase family protein, partial [Solirubrobacterales bacterium]|nr:SGNH/GDSL hydrolase family protein [Solirubrobacterales bacterium]